MIREATTGAWLLALAGCHTSTETVSAAKRAPGVRAAAQGASPDWAVFMRPHVRSVAWIAGDTWKDGKLAVSQSQVRSYRDAQADRLSTDSPVSPFTDAAAGDGGMLWATAAGAIYRTADPVAPLEPVEGVRGWRVAALGRWGVVCSDGEELVRVALEGPAKPEPMERPCKRVESTRGKLFVEDADGWSVTLDLETFTSQTHRQQGTRPASRETWPNPGAIARVANTWRTADGSLMDGRASLAAEDHDGPERGTPHELHCRRSVGASGVRAICSVPDRGDVLYGWDDGWSEQHERADGSQAWRRGTISRFSNLAAFTGPCKSDEALEPGELAVCVIGAERQPRTHRLSLGECEAGRADCEETDGGRGHVVLHLSGIEPGVLVYSLDPEASKSHILDLRDEPSAALPRCERYRLAGPAHLECTADAAELKVFSLVDGAATSMPVPKDATWVGFASTTHGMAAGLNAASLWTTEDGGASWQPVDVELSGAPDSLPLAPVTCTNIACAAGPVVWVEGEAAEVLGLESVRYVGFERTPLEAHAMSAPW